MHRVACGKWYPSSTFKLGACDVTVSMTWENVTVSTTGAECDSQV